MAKVDVIYDNGSIRMPFMFSDGPETIDKTVPKLPQTLLCYGKNIKTEQPIKNMVEIEMYHNNNMDKTLRFGILVKNASSSSIKIEKRYLTTIANSDIPSDQKDKVEKCARLEADFANKDYKIETVVLGGNTCGFALALDVPKKKLICARMRITLKDGADLNKFYVRTVVCDPSDTPNNVWNNSTEYDANKNVAESGQFAGVVSYYNKFLDVTVNNYGDYFYIFNTGLNPYNISPTATNLSDSDIPTELFKPIYTKAESRPVFDGNFGITYHIGIFYPEKGGFLKITPYETTKSKQGKNLYAAIAIHDPNANTDWEKTPTLKANETTGKFGGAWFYELPPSEEGKAKEGRDVDIILPGGNYGLLKLEYVEYAK